MKTFQTVILLAFGGIGVIGFLIFAGSSGKGAGSQIGSVVIWGTLDARIMNAVLSSAREQSDARAFNQVKYVSIDQRIFDEALVEAIAANRGPDMILLSQDSILEKSDKIITIPFNIYPERLFKDKFIEEGELYLTSGGILGIPFLIDPLVMYWNRDMFSSAGIASPPKFWNEFFLITEELTKRDQANNIIRSTIAFGEFVNVTNAKEILIALVLQAGSPITKRLSSGELESDFGRSRRGVFPANAALSFYTEFSNPVKKVYSWNRALPESRQAFLAGDLAVYFGFASELSFLRAANPNLNFDVAILPQSQNSDRRTTYGRMEAFAIPLQTKNYSGAFQVAALLTSDAALVSLVELSGLPPVSRQLLAIKPIDARLSIFYDSALISRAWLDPDKELSSKIFSDMVESITSGRARVTEAISTADKLLTTMLKGR